MKRASGIVMMAFIFCLINTGLIWGAEYPTRSINILIGYAAGGSTDLSVRALAAEASKTLKQPIVCSNQVGAAGTLVLGRVKARKARWVYHL